MKSFIEFIKSRDLKYAALRIALVYAVFSALWILLSDQILLYLVNDVNFLTQIQMLKGWFFILVTSVLIFFLLKREIDRYLRAEEFIRESERRFREMADLLPQTIFELDTNYNVTYTNQYGFNSYGYSNSDLKNSLNIMKLFTADDQEKLTESIKRILENEPSRGTEFTALRKDGTTFPVLIYAQPIFKDTKPVGLRGIVIDIAERKKFEEQLRQVQKLETVGILAGGLAHDFNNLLTPILGYSDLLQRNIKSGSDDETSIKHIQNSAIKAQEITRQLLAIGRKQELDIETIDLNKLIADFESILRHSIHNSIELQLKLNNADCVIKADRSQIEQILLNLVINAGDAMPEGGKVVIKTSTLTLDQSFIRMNPEIKAGKYAMVAVDDNGIGMDPETLKQIFEPFYSTKAKSKGSGLGLSTVHGIARQHNGTITVDSELEKGTSFKVYLPLAEILIRI